MNLHSVLNYNKMKISTNDNIQPRSPPLPQIPNYGNPSVHNYVLSEYKDKRNIGKGKDLVYPDTWLLH